MSLYDVINDITEKQVTKTKTGDERIYGVLIGTVVKNYDQKMPGRVCVSIATRDDSANELRWARQAQMSSGNKWGHYFLPEIGDQVLLVFEGGNIEKPYIIGCVPKDKNNFLTKSVDPDNQTKRIVTKHGNSITFFDDKDDENGLKDKISISTANSEHTVLMDNENKMIKIHDKNKENFIEFKTEKGNLNIKAQNNITIQVGDQIKITMNGQSGAINIQAKDIKNVVSNSFNVKSDTSVRIEGANVSMKASSSLKADSSGSVQILGAPISIG